MMPLHATTGPKLERAQWLDFWVGWQGGESDGHVHRRHDDLGDSLL